MSSRLGTGDISHHGKFHTCRGQTEIGQTVATHIINKGRVVATNSPETLVAQLTSGSGYELEIAGDLPALQAHLQAIAGVKFVERLPRGRGVVGRDAEARRRLLPLGVCAVRRRRRRRRMYRGRVGRCRRIVVLVVVQVALAVDAAHAVLLLMSSSRWRFPLNLRRLAGLRNGT